MGCEKRNKKLFKHIAIGVLILVIIYILVEVFLSGKNIVEGMDNTDMINYNKDVEAWVFKPGEIETYVKAHHDVIMENKNNEDVEEENFNVKHFISLMGKIKTKIGQGNFQLLQKAIQNDPNGKFGSLIADQKEAVQESYFAFAEDAMKTLRSLIEDMESRRAKVKTG
jgi:hypothetical protein